MSLIPNVQNIRDGMVKVVNLLLVLLDFSGMVINVHLMLEIVLLVHIGMDILVLLLLIGALLVPNGMDLCV